MKTIAYYPAARMLSVLDEDGYGEISYCGGIAERKFFEALDDENVNVSIVGGDFKMKLKPANMQAFILSQAVLAEQTFTVRKGVRV
jgi:hypothetical protein